MNLIIAYQAIVEIVIKLIKPYLTINMLLQTSHETNTSNAVQRVVNMKRLQILVLQ